MWGKQNAEPQFGQGNLQTMREAFEARFSFRTGAVSAAGTAGSSGGNPRSSAGGMGNDGIGNAGGMGMDNAGGNDDKGNDDKGSDSTNQSSSRNTTRKQLPEDRSQNKHGCPESRGWESCAAQLDVLRISPYS